MGKDHINPGANVDWCTPNQILVPVREFFGGEIDLDPASNENSIVKATVEYRLPINDGLKDSWDVCENRPTNVYVNPPFGRCYVRDDRLSVLSAKEWTKGRKLFREWSEHFPPTYTLEAAVAGGAITDVEAARYTSTSVIDWARKAAAEYQSSDTQVLKLIPAAVDTQTWQKVVFPTASAVCWIEGRIKFLGNVKGPAPMACAIVGWVEDAKRFLNVFAKTGFCQKLR